MRRLFKSILALAALAFAACTVEMAPDGPESSSNLVTKTWNVSFGDDSRAFLGDNLKPVWEEGEELSVFDPLAQVGRIFTVTKVEGSVATITGEISEGNFAFKAAYPAKNVTGWTASGECSYLIPSAQEVSAGRTVDPYALVSTASTDTPQNGIVFHNQVALLKFQVDKDDIKYAYVGLDNGGPKKLYMLASQNSFTPGTDYFLAVDPGQYDGIELVAESPFGVSYSKTSTKALTANASSIVSMGNASEKASRSYDIKGRQTIANLDAFIASSGLSGSIPPELTAIIPTYFPNYTEEMTLINFTYGSVDPKGNPATLSGVIYVPTKAITDKRTTKGIVLANHATIASDAECPSRALANEGCFAWRNFAVVLSDYYGFGESAAYPQAYLNPECTARGNLDAYLTALQILEDEGVKLGKKKYNAGYSQGGFNSMANLKYLSEHPEYAITFDRSYAGGGPYDVLATTEGYFNGGFTSAAVFVPMTVISINECEKLGLDYSKIFKGSLLSNWQEWILSKKYDVGTISSKLPSKNLADLLTTSMFNQTGAEYDAIMEVADRYSLVKGWAPLDKSKIYIYHSTQDDTVPYSNFESFQTYLKSVAPSGCTLQFQSGADGGHIAACVKFIMNVAPTMI